MDDHRDALTEIDRALVDALDVDVSAGFQARVRQRIATESMRAPVWHGWRIAVAAAAAAVVIAAIGLAMMATRGQPPLLSARSLPLGPLRPADVRPIRPALAADRAVPSARVRAASVVASTPSANEPEVLVPREEIETYRRLIAEAQNVTGALLVAAPPDIVAVRTFGDLTIEPIKPIEPIKIDSIIPSLDGEGDRQ